MADVEPIAVDKVSSCDDKEMLIKGLEKNVAF
jgi:hypothetical protein